MWRFCVMGRWVIVVLMAMAASIVAAQSSRSPDQATALRRTPIVEVFETTRDAVVNISSTQVLQVRSINPIDQLFEGFFDVPRELRPNREIRRTSVGSGFVLHPDGYVVTNAHVVERTAERKVIFADGREYDARVIAADSMRDLAVLKIDADGPLPAVTLGNSSDLMIGEPAVAIGNPLGYQHTLTSGVISAINRELPVSEEVTFRGLIQTDASINPGNSGGPLLNILGQLIGVTTAIRADAQNIGFAIPVDQLRQVLPEMLDVERRYGIVVGMVVKDAEDRCIVSEISPESPLAKSDLQVGMSLEEVDRKPIHSATDFYIALIGRKPGDTVEFMYRMGTERAKRGEIQLAARPKPDGAKLLSQRLGVTAQPLDAKMARGMGIAGAKGLLIDHLDPVGPAGQAGIERGDVILQIGRHEATSLDEVGQLLDQTPSGAALAVDVLRVVGRTIYRLRVRMVTR